MLNDNKIVQLSRSKFLKDVCKKCSNEQIIFNKASSVVKCSEILARPTGGEAEITGKILKVLS